MRNGFASWSPTAVSGGLGCNKGNGKKIDQRSIRFLEDFIAAEIFDFLTSPEKTLKCNTSQTDDAIKPAVRLLPIFFFHIIIIAFAYSIL
jgi:hypothetical protein